MASPAPPDASGTVKGKIKSGNGKGKGEPVSGSALDKNLANQSQLGAAKGLKGETKSFEKGERGFEKGKSTPTKDGYIAAKGKAAGKAKSEKGEKE